MLDEISAAVLFIVRLIEKSENFNKDQLQEFKRHLSDLLVEKFKNHWFPDQPCKGQGYRCIRVNERNRRDATLEKAALACGLKYEDLKLPVELTLWVDPNEVCCRFGEHRGSYCTLATFSGKENVSPDENNNKAGCNFSENKQQILPLTVSNKPRRPRRGAPRKAWPVPPALNSWYQYAVLHSPWLTPPLCPHNHQPRNCHLPPCRNNWRPALKV